MAGERGNEEAKKKKEWNDGDATLHSMPASRILPHPGGISTILLLRLFHKTVITNSLRSADFLCSVFWGTPLFVLKHDDRRGEIAPLDACQVTLMTIDLHEDLYKAKNISVFHERN